MTKLLLESRSTAIAQRMQLLIDGDYGTVGTRILQTIDEFNPVSAEEFAIAMLKYRQGAITLRPDFLEHVQSVMRVMLDSLLAREQAKAQRTQYWASIILGAAAVLVTLLQIFGS